MMSTLKQLVKNFRVIKQKKIKNAKSGIQPQFKAVCVRVLTMSPKKPNSANRKIIKTRLTINKSKITAKLPGEFSNLQQHSVVLLKGAKIKDLIGVKHLAIRGKYDFTGVLGRKTRRSLYGVKQSR